MPRALRAELAPGPARAPARGAGPARLLARAALAACLAWLGPAPARAACTGADLFPPSGVLGEGDPAQIRLQAASLPFRFGRLYGLELPGRAPSYILGTVHLADPRVSHLTKGAEAALAGARVVAVETLDAGSSGLREEGARLRADTPERRPERLLDARAFAALTDLARRRGLDPGLTRVLKPTVVALMLDLPPCAVAGPGARYLDAEVLARARAQGTPVVGLETLREQLEAVDGLGAEAERGLLDAVLAQAPYADDIVETTIRRYGESDAGGLLAWMRSPAMIPGQPEAVVPPVFLDRLITGRNRRLSERIAPLVEQGGAFVAIGLAHLPGPDGLLARLQARGVRVDAIE